MRGGIVSIGIASAVIATALLVLVYRGGVAGPEPAWVGWLPFVNAFFNSVSALAIVLGFAAIRRGRRDVHQRWMFTALAASGVFLVSYVTYHALHGDSRFLGQGVVRPIYFAHPDLPHPAVRGRAAAGAVDVLPVALGPLRRPPARGPLDVPDLAVRLGHRRRRLRDAADLRIRAGRLNAVSGAGLSAASAGPWS